MQQRGRKSSSSKVASVSKLPDRLPQPPKEYSDEMAELWSSVVSTKPADWFDAGSLPVLDTYCRSIIEYRRVSDLIEKIHPIENDDEFDKYRKLEAIHERLAKAILSAGTKLRLTPQSRYNAQSAATAAKKGGASKLWQKG